MNYRIEGIDYLRAMMSVFVVIWHMGGGGRSLIFSQDAYLQHVFTVSDFINFHLLLLAVPVFIFASIFLYSLKPASSTGFKKQFTRIFLLLSFWPIALILYRNGYQGLAAIVPSSPSDVVYIILRAGKTIYYFFTSLIICLFIAHLFMQINRKLQISLFLISIVLLAALPQLTKMTGFYPLSAYWSPLNFIPLSFAAVLCAQNRESIIKNRTVVLLLSLVLCVLFSIFEWNYSVDQIFIPGQGYAIPAYTRTSLLFAVMAVFTVMLDPRIKANSIIKYMAQYSLALYCLHPFLISPVKRMVSLVFHDSAIALSVSIIFVVISSYFIAMLLQKYYLRERVIM